MALRNPEIARLVPKPKRPRRLSPQAQTRAVALSGKRAELERRLRELSKRRARARKLISRVCAAARRRTQARIAARRAKVQAAMRKRAELERAAQRCTCARKRAAIQAASARLEATIRAWYDRERDLVEAVHGGRVTQDSAARIAARRARERLEESDDAVLANLPPELHPVWQRWKRGIKGSARRSRTEAFLEEVEANPEEVAALLSGSSMAEQRALERELATAQAEWASEQRETDISKLAKRYAKTGMSTSEARRRATLDVDEPVPF